MDPTKVPTSFAAGPSSTVVPADIFLEVCVLIDATESMRPSFATCKEFLAALGTRLRSVRGLKGIRVGCVAYRDFMNAPDGQHVEVLPFTGDTQAAAEWIAALKPVGNTDFAEDVRGGLEAALGLRWHTTNSLTFTKLIVHIGDAPAHGARYHDLGVANDARLNEPAPAGKQSLEELCAKACSMGIDYCFVSVHSAAAHTRKMAAVMESAYNGAIPVRLNFQCRELESADAQALASVLLKVAEGSVMFSKRTIGERNACQRPDFMSGGGAGGSAAGGAGGGGGSGGGGGGGPTSKVAGTGTTVWGKLASIAGDSHGSNGRGDPV